MTPATSLRLPLDASRSLAAWMVAAHAVAATCVALAWPASPGFLAAALVLVLGGAAGWRLALLRASTSPAALVLGEEGGFVVVLRDGRMIESGPGVRFVTRRWVVLRTRSAACPTVLVGAGMLGPPDFRRLRIWALWNRVPGSTPSGSFA